MGSLRDLRRPAGLAKGSPPLRIEALQLLERKAAPQARRDVPRHEGGFHQDRAASAHGIEQRLLRRPPRQAQDARRQVLSERRLAARLAQATLEQRLARCVEVQRQVLSVQKGINADVGLAGVYAGPNAGGRTEPIADGVFDLERDVIKARERAMLRAELELDRAAGGKPVGPGQVIGHLIHVLLGPVGAMKDAPEYPAGDPAFQIDPVAEAERTGEPDAPGGRRDVSRAQLLQLGREHAAQPARAPREEGLVWGGGAWPL